MRRLTREARLRIGVVAPAVLSVPPIGYGGIERVVSELVEGLVANGHDVTLFASEGSVTSARLISPLATPSPLGHPDALAEEIYHAATAYLHAREFDVIHDHTSAGPLFGAVARWDTRVIHTLHGAWTPQNRRMAALIDRRVGLVAISRAQRAANSQLHYADMVYNGINLSSHPFNPAKEDFLVFVGRISSGKRPEIAIDIARKAKLPLVMMIKRTEPAEQAYWRDVVTPRLGSDVTVLDEPSHTVKVDLLGRARAMLFPIDWPEPFGLVMTESMACGTPVIASSLGAAPEVIADGTTGFLCSTVGQMVNAVGRAKDLKAQDCRDRVVRRFSSEAMVAGYERVYLNALERETVRDIASWGSSQTNALGSKTCRTLDVIVPASLA